MFAAKSHRGSSRGFSASALACAVFLTALGSFVEPTSAQRFKSLQPKMNIRAAKQMRGDVAAAMNNVADFQAGGKKVIEDYFTDYYFRQMTVTTPQAMQELGEMREDLFKRYLRAADVPAAREYLTNLTLNVMRVIARDTYHPAVRYNAALTIGMLDKENASAGANPTPPVVLPEGTKELLDLLEQKAFKEVPVHPSVKAAALEGLERHVRFGVDAQYKDRITQAVLAVLTQEPSALGVDADVNNWIKCQAVRVLVRQFKDGPTPEVQAAITKLIADDKISIEDRVCVVGLLDKIEYPNTTEANLKDTLAPLGQLTKEVVDEGAETAKDFEDLILGKNPGARRRAPMGRGRGDEGPKLERRLLLSRLLKLRDGADSLSKGLPDEDKQKVDALLETLKPVISKTRDKNSLDLEVTGEVLKLKNSIDSVVANWKQAPGAEAAPDAEEPAFN